MDEYIKRNSAIGWAVSGQILTFPHTEDGEKWIRVNEVRESLQSVPAADVRPVKRGHWVKRMEEHTTPKYKSFTPIWPCSECGLDYNPALAPRIHFCYNCGADLREYGNKGRLDDV